MEPIGEEAPVLDSGVDHEATKSQESVEDTKPTYKSFKKKYRKMRINFDEKMALSNELYTREAQAEEKAKRLAQEISQLLDLLLDVNDSPQISAEKRIELSDVPSLAAIPPLVTEEELSKAAAINTPAGQGIYSEIRSLIDEKAAFKEAAKNGLKPRKPLALLMATVPHLSANSPLISPGLLASFEPPEGRTVPISYLTPDEMDEYLYEIDSSLRNAPAAPHTQSPSHDLALKNPNSVYNWLRKNAPKVFLQDGEGSEKSLGKPGALRGAGKRASLPAPSKPDAIEFVEEDGIGYDASMAGPVGTKGKRKRDDTDDGAYHPKSGRADELGMKVKKQRGGRKKKSEGLGETVASTPGRKSKKDKEKDKEKTRASSQSGAEPHPFGPV